MDTDKLKATLLIAEGTRLTVYDDATGRPIVPGTYVHGHPTIGVGRALDVHGISVLEQDMLLDNDLVHCEADAAALVGSSWYSIADARQRALVELRFNMGEGGLASFHLMLAAVRTAQWETAATLLLDSNYARELPSRSARIAKQLRDGI